MKITGKRQSHLFADVVKTIIKIVISLIVISLQLAFYYFLFVELYNLWYIQLFLEVVGFIWVIVLYRKNVNESYKISWIALMLLFPFVGTAFFILFGSGYAIPYRQTKRITEAIKDKIPQNDCIEKLRKTDERGAMLAQALKNTTNLPLYENTELEFLPSGEQKHKRLLNDLENAKEFIFVEYFIISDGSVLKDVMDVLRRKGNEGVKIKFLYDDVGSKKALKRKTKKELASIPNLELCVFEPVGVLISPRINYRDHRKIVVIDGKIGYVGGDNLADEYVNKLVKYGHWRDNAMRLCGEAVYSLSLIFAETWYLSCNEKIELPQFTKSEIRRSDTFVQPFGDGSSNSSNPSYKLFEGLVSSAQKSLYISTPYFIIDNAFINKIAIASLSGVDVRLLVPHIPDKKMVFAVTRGHYGALIKAGVKVYEYTPGFNHAKNFIVDGRYAFIGTVNCDYRSLTLHFENGVFIAGGEQVQKMNEDFLSATERSELITYEKWKKRPLISKIADVLLSFIAPML